ncbi:MAG: hypothetical protein M1812_001422 [Candelaria pacifica]|nr:MAG: hypothetical protein M1812_001422 [Candelaria pacifica]
MSSQTPRTPSGYFPSPSPSLGSGQFPFPQYDTPSRSGAAGRYRPRQGSTASSISSIGGVLDTTAQSKITSTREAGQNAIFTLLQPPIVRTGLVPPSTAGQKAPSSKDIPPVTLTNIPHIEPAVFKPYLLEVGSLYDAFQRAREEGGEGGSQLFSRNKGSASKREEATSLSDQGSRRNQIAPSFQRHGSVASIVSTSPETPRPIRRPSGQRSGHAVAPLSTIPAVYFEQDFHLENPRTFDVVSERSDVIRPVPGTPSDERKGANGSVVTSGAPIRKALATNAILQEKLSWYMDTVEIHLISSISTASTSFFAALGSLRELHSDAAESVTRIRGLREDLRQLDKDMAEGGLKIVAMQKRRENMRKLGDAVGQLRKVVDGVTQCGDLVENGDIEMALDGLNGIERLIAGESGADRLKIGNEKPFNHDGALLDLRGVKALEGVTDDLGRLRYRIGKGFEARFLESLLGDLRHHVEDVPPRDTLQRWSKASQRSRGDHGRAPSSFPAYLNLDTKLRSNLLSHLNGLSRSHQTTPATTAYRDAVLREIKSLIRRYLPSSDDDDNESMMSASTHGGRHLSQQEKSSILARNLRAMDPSEAETMLAKTYTGVGEILRRLGVQVKVLLDITSGIGSPLGSAGMKSPPKSPSFSLMNGYLDPNGAPPTTAAQLQQEMNQALDMSSLLGQAVDIAQTQITKVLKVRTDQSTQLPLSLFLRYVTLNRLFADECELVSGRGGTALKNVVNGHIQDFVAQLGGMEKQRLAETMEADLWDAKDFGEAETATLARVLDGSTRDAEAWTKGNQIWLSQANGDSKTPMPNGLDKNSSATTSGRDRLRNAQIDEERFILPHAAMAVLEGVEKFENLVTGIPTMTSEVVSTLLEYLKLFNSRSCQLILGAGATRSAGLKNITTKHLAIASQALSFIIALVPYIREFVRRHSPSSSGLMTEFDKVKRLYQDHQSAIHDKLVEIMSGRATTHVKSMRKVEWDEPPKDSLAASPYMETLVKETSTLHRVLSKHLPEMTVRMIMYPVFGSYKEQWGKAFREVMPKTARGKERMLRDAELFSTKLSKLEGSADIGDYIVKIVKDKVVEQQSGNFESANGASGNPSATESIEDPEAEKR